MNSAEQPYQANIVSGNLCDLESSFEINFRPLSRASIIIALDTRGPTTLLAEHIGKDVGDLTRDQMRRSSDGQLYNVDLDGHGDELRAVRIKGMGSIEGADARMICNIKRIFVLNSEAR